MPDASIPERTPVPRIFRDNYPEEERSAIHYTLGNLQRVADFDRALECAVILFNYATVQFDLAQAAWKESKSDEDGERTRIYAAWERIAARDGALQIDHFGDAFEGVNTALHGCTEAKQYVDHTRIKAARRMLNEFFPHRRHIRDCVAHLGLIAKDPKRAGEHAIGNIIFAENMNGNIYQTGWEGTHYRFEIGPISLGNLIAVRNELFAAFADERLKYPKGRPGT